MNKQLLSWALVLFWCAGGQCEPNSPMSYTGVCDASAAVALDLDSVVVADDESNVLRIYSRTSGGPPLQEVDLSRFLMATPKGPEADIEAAARMGDRIYWITSHGLSASGRTRPNRRQFFATSVSFMGRGVELRPLGMPYRSLLRDLLEDPRLRPFDLLRASSMAPQQASALNIEGLAATPEGGLLLGFRNPVPHGRALLVPLLNPSELLEGGRARFGPPQLLDLGGSGIRSLERTEDGYLIIAGRPGAGGTSRLFRWSGGPDRPRQVPAVQFAGFNPEAIAVCPGTEDNPVLFVTSDDGTRRVNGVPCKELKDPRQKSFRGLLMRIPAVAER